MSWGTSAHGAIRLPVDDLQDFRDAYDLVEADAEIVGGLFEVDLWDTELPLDRPMMVQFLIGHPTRSRVLVHSDGLTHYAVGSLQPDHRHEARYERPGGTFVAEPESLTITPLQAREVVAEFVRTGRQPDSVHWAERPMD